MNKLLAIQIELKAPKDLQNKFGGYMYRSFESILESLKPVLAKHEAILIIADEVVPVGNRIYVKATATLKIGEEVVVVSAFAREEETKKGMDSSQITGAASSYARKYALNGLFLIDDTKDSDFTHGMTDERQRPERKSEQEKLAESAALAKLKYNARLGPVSSAMGQMAPKDSPEATEGPTNGNPVAIGLVMYSLPPNGGGFVNFAIDGYQKESGKDIMFSSRDKDVIAKMKDAIANETKVAVSYIQNDNPSYANSITEVK